MATDKCLHSGGNPPFCATLHRTSWLALTGLAASFLFLSGCTRGASRGSATETSFVELERMTSDLENFEYLGCDRSHYYFQVPGHGYFKLPFAEIDASADEPSLPLLPLVVADPLDAIHPRLIVTIAHGKIVPTGMSYDDQRSSTPIWWRLFVVAAVLTGLWFACRPRYSIRIAVKRGKITIDRGIPRARIADVLKFLGSLNLEGTVVILGARDRNRNLRITFRGRIDPGTGQRIRNYLKMTL